ncbi:hypothetical protein CsatA_005014 [Cannabis sativa]
MKSAHFLVTLAIFALASSIASAYDPSPLQDFCVAVDDPEKACQGRRLFSSLGWTLDTPRDTHNPIGSNVTQLNVDMIRGLNTVGITLACIDFAPYGQNPPHTHPRGTEIREHSTLDGKNRLFTKVLNKGDVFVFPIGLIHFQFNKGHTPAVAFAALSSQNAGVITIANAVFGSDPPINPDVLAKAFQVDKNIIDHLQKQFWYDNN